MKVARDKVPPRQASSSTVVYSYPSGVKDLSIALIKVNGRHPHQKNAMFIEHGLTVLFYIIEGKGKVTIEKAMFEVQTGDTITIEKENKYFLEGNLVYIAATSPAYYKEQNEVVIENS